MSSLPHKIRNLGPSIADIYGSVLMEEKMYDMEKDILITNNTKWEYLFSYIPIVTQQERVKIILKYEAYFQNIEKRVTSLTNLICFIAKKQKVIK